MEPLAAKSGGTRPQNPDCAASGSIRATSPHTTASLPSKAEEGLTQRRNAKEINARVPTSNMTA